MLGPEKLVPDSIGPLSYYFSFIYICIILTSRECFLLSFEACNLRTIFRTYVYIRSLQMDTFIMHKYNE